MQNQLTLPNTICRSETAAVFAVDTTFVLFFLAVEMGSTIGRLDAGNGLSAVTLVSFIAVPYFLPFEGEKPAFLRWVAGRAAIAALAIVLGVAFSFAVGTTLPESFRFLPMSLLIVAAAVSSIVQAYVIMKNRLAR
jgi:hypothetical protein